MGRSRLRKIMEIVFLVVIIIAIMVGFSFSNDSDNVYMENYTHFDDGWKIDDNNIEFPYGESQETFTITNKLPMVYSDQYLVMWVYYDTFEAYVDNELVCTSKDNVFGNISTDAGKKEIWIPMLTHYSGKKITLKMTLQKELYGASITKAFISTRGEYAARTLKDNIMTMLVYASFTITGIVEIIIAGTFTAKNYSEERKRIFKALLYAGVFSVISAQWLINDCRLSYIVFGHIVGFSILNIIAFLFMPVFFFRMQRYLYERDNKVAIGIDEGLTALAFFGVIAALFGLVNWGDLIYLGQLICFTVLAIVGYYSVTNIIHTKEYRRFASISVANIAFVLLAVAALLLYIGSVISTYNSVILLALHIYVFVQIVMIYKRVSQSLKEELELAQTKIYAFSDELTGLGNRRKYYHAIDEYDGDNLPENFAIIMVDTNRLKYYNDNLGHDAGDELIVSTAKCLKYAFGHLPEVNICRIGGDEFAISLVASKNEIEAAIVSFKSKMEGWKGDYVEGLSAGVGYASRSDYPEASVIALQGKADEAMYKDKSNFYKESGFDRRESR